MENVLEKEIMHDFKWMKPLSILHKWFVIDIFLAGDNNTFKRKFTDKSSKRKIWSGAPGRLSLKQTIERAIYVFWGVKNSGK